jgi:uncharacterized membrane protein YgcG
MVVALSFAIAWPGCAGEPDEGRPASEAGQTAARAQAATVPGKGAPDTLDVASWNIEFLGDSSNGPSNETLQRANARDILAGADMDVWGLAEIVSTSGFNALKAQLPGYGGFLANDPLVLGGSASYGSSEQKVGLLFKTSVVSVVSARIILADHDFDFAGRPPLQTTLRVTLNGVTEDVTVIVLHAKCCSDSQSLQRRRNAANALKGYLDSTFPSGKVWVIGDFNDDLDASITPGNASPYAPFVNDPADYRFSTEALTDAGVSSTVDFDEMIDHHLTTADSHALYLDGSAEVYRVDEFIANYGSTTSDHFPVLSRYTWGGGGGGNAGGGGGGGGGASGGGGGGGTAEVIINEIGANELGSSTAGEFVELVNVGTAAAALDGWTLADGSSTRHAFAAGTTLAAGRAIVVFGGASGVPGDVTNAIVASSGGLSLANGGDSVTLRDDAGATRDSFSYPSSLATRDGVSMNRNPDGSANAPFVAHDGLSSLPRSPGERASGAAF